MSSYRVVPQGVSRAMIALVVFGATACSDATGVLEPTAVAVETPAAGIVLSGSGTWTAMPAIGEASEFNCAITIGNYIWVMGGDRELGEMRTIYRYRPNTGTWTEMGSIPVEVPSSWCSIHEVGGKYYYSADVGSTLIWEWSPTLGTFTPLAAGPTPHVWSSTTATADHIYRMGGNGTPSMERYDPATNTWETLAPMPSAVFWGEAVHINGKIYFAGGIGAGGNIFVYDIAANAWETRPGAPSLTFPNVNVLDGIIYAVNLTTTHAYTPSTNTWVQVSPHPTGLYRGASTVFGARIIHLGGRDGLLSDVTNAVQSFRPAYAGNHAPIVNFGAYGTREEGVEILFDATYSDPDGDAVSSWSWNFGDGETSDLQSVNHTYASPGSYTVTLTASDGDLSTTKTRTVVINPAIPNPIGAFGAAWNAGTSAVDLEWTFSGDGYEPSRAEVQRQNWNIYSSAYEAWHVPSGLELDLNSASDGSVNANMQYRYRVRSCRQTRCGAWVVGTAIKTADLPGTSTISAAPFAPGMLLLTFTVAAGEDYYEIARRSRAVTTDPWSAWSTVGSVTDADPLIDSGLPTNSIYQYRVRTCNYAGCSAWSLSQPRRVP